MAEASELVREFRGIVDNSVLTRIETSELCPVSRTGIINGLLNNEGVTEAAGLTFASVEGPDPEIPLIDIDGSVRWVALTEQLYNWGTRRVGRLAVVSVVEEPDQLFRHWAFESAGRSIPVETKREIDDVHELQQVVGWAKSPHLYTDILLQLAELSAGEELRVAQQLAERAAATREHTQELLRMGRGRRPQAPHFEGDGY